ncbi:hypothetical protein F4561_005202 [Lipingzhangella halophila]|uniref:DNA methylase N-4/N-6 domain-containing protein n=1 Tax=Lipingzhangella halophila TaxID=1783352 RepID=A0A7W7RLV2_9ACTN|nr:DNA methyltransferase [Lipingzhangella halophila]MBB4934382.1 hypothetical protein [Lipingzhangella halophila]
MATPDPHGPPLAVWPTAQQALADQRAQYPDLPPVAFPVMAPALAQRLVTELSQPGDLVADLMCGSGTVCVEALDLERHVLAVDCEPACVAQTRDTLDARPQAPALVEQLWQADAREAGDLLVGYRGCCDLIVIAPPAPATGSRSTDSLQPANLARLDPEAHDGAMVDVLAACAVLLRPGGCLAVLTQYSPRWAGRLLDPLPRTVSAAAEAGLEYHQHIIVLTHPLRHGRIHARPAPPRRITVSSTAAVATLHSNAHANICLFRKPFPSAPEVGEGLNQ